MDEQQKIEPTRRRRRRSKRRRNPLTLLVLLLLLVLSAPYSRTSANAPEITVKPENFSGDYNFETEWNSLPLSPVKESVDKLPDALR